MESPFLNDCFGMLWIAFCNLYPENKDKVQIQWQPNLFDEVNNENCYGMTEYVEEEDFYYVSVTPEIKVLDAIEILAHELAHCGVGVEHGHDEVWAKSFEDLFNEYNRIGDEIFGFDRKDKVEVDDGKSYVSEEEWDKLTKGNKDGSC